MPPRKKAVKKTAPRIPAVEGTNFTPVWDSMVNDFGDGLLQARNLHAKIQEAWTWEP